MISLLHGDTRHVKVSHFKCMGAHDDHVVKRNVERSDGMFLKETLVTKLCRLLDESYTYVYSLILPWKYLFPRDETWLFHETWHFHE